MGINSKNAAFRRSGFEKRKLQVFNGAEMLPVAGDKGQIGFDRRCRNDGIPRPDAVRKSVLFDVNGGAMPDVLGERNQIEPEGY